jgi:ABC-2 type transport system ATP-binding protein/lipopolysaccharide transport system ATP-binding protein
MQCSISINHFIDTQLKNYSSGMQMRLGLSVLVHLEPIILLADEILAVNDQLFQDKCQDEIGDLRRNGMMLIFELHNRERVDNFCDQFVRLEHGQVVESSRLPLASNATSL